MRSWSALPGASLNVGMCSSPERTGCSAAAWSRRASVTRASDSRPRPCILDSPIPSGSGTRQSSRTSWPGFRVRTCWGATSTRGRTDLRRRGSRNACGTRSLQLEMGRERPFPAGTPEPGLTISSFPRRSPWNGRGSAKTRQLSRPPTTALCSPTSSWRRPPSADPSLDEAVGSLHDHLGIVIERGHVVRIDRHDTAKCVPTPHCQMKSHRPTNGEPARDDDVALLAQILEGSERLGFPVLPSSRCKLLPARTVPRIPGAAHGVAESRQRRAEGAKARGVSGEPVQEEHPGGSSLECERLDLRDDLGGHPTMAL